MIVGGIAYQFLFDQYNGLHDLENDALFFAMYNTTASLDRTTIDTYTTTDELVGNGYTAGGAALTQTIIGGPPDITGLDFADLVFTGATWGQTAGTAAQSALIYNTTHSNKVIAVIPFGSPRASNGGTFTVIFPDSTNPSLVMIRGVA